MAQLPQNARGTFGRSGTINFSGIISGEEYNRNLTGILANHKYEIMRRSDSTIRGALQVCKLPVLSTQWKIKAALGDDGKVDPKDQEIADFIDHQLFHSIIDFDNFMRQALSCLDFGFSVFEKEWDGVTFRGQPRIGLISLQSRKQVSIIRWHNEANEPYVLQQLVSGTYEIPMAKLCVITHDKEGENYEGISLLRYVYKDWKIKDDLTIINAIGMEKQAIGVPLVEARENQDPTPQDELKAEEVLGQFRANEKAFLMMPKTLTVSMLDMKASSNKEVIPTLNYHDARIMKSILAGFLELGGASGSGSQSLSKDLTSLFMKSEEALATMLASAINEQVIKQLCDWNYSDLPNGYPKIDFGNIADDDTTALASSLKNLTDAGLLTPDADLEDYLRTLLHVPQMSEDMKNSYEDNRKLKQQQAADAAAAAKDQPVVETKPKAKEKDVNATVKASATYRARLIGMLAEG